MLFLVGSCPSEVHQAGPVACRVAPVGQFLAAGARAELFRQRDRDHLHPGRRCLPRVAGAQPAARAGHGTCQPDGGGHPGRCGRGPVPAPVQAAGHGAGAVFPTAALDRSAGHRPADPFPARATLPGRYRAHARGPWCHPPAGTFPAGRRRHHAVAPGGRDGPGRGPGPVRPGHGAGPGAQRRGAGTPPQPAGRQAGVLLPGFAARGAHRTVSLARTGHGTARGGLTLPAPPAPGPGDGAAALRHGAQRRPAC